VPESANRRRLGIVVAEVQTSDRDSACSANVSPASIPGFDPLVHSLLSSPAVHRLLADAEIDRDVTHTSSSGDQFQVSLPKLRRISPSAHAVLLLGQQHGSPVIRLHKTRVSPLGLLSPSHRGGSVISHKSVDLPGAGAVNSYSKWWCRGTGSNCRHQVFQLSELTFVDVL
jgi:hypothetical protein